MDGNRERRRDVGLVACLLLAATVLTVLMYALTGQNFLAHLGLHVVLAICSCIAVAYDWNTLGPTMALQQGATAAALAWLVVVPLGTLVRPLLSAFSTLTFIATGVALSVVVCIFLECVGCVLSIFIIAGSIFVSQTAPPEFTDMVNTVLLFLMIFWFIRQALTMQRIDFWPGVTRLESGSMEYQTQCDYFWAASLPWAHKYPFELSIQSVFRVDKDGAMQGPKRREKESANERYLFHGTQWSSAKGIVCDGFRLPRNPGMFGKGIYFADCPLKSWRYCFASRKMSQALTAVTGRGGLILMAWVHLGKQRQERQANYELGGFHQRGWWARLTGGRGAYDSVVGVEEEAGGALRVPEYVIYDPTLARVDYIFEVVAKPTPRGPSVH